MEGPVNLQGAVLGLAVDGAAEDAPLARWAILLYVPYNLVLLLTVVLLSPAVAFAELNGSRDASRRVTLGTMIVEVIIACAVIIAVTAIGHRIALRLARRRQARLVAYLNDPDNG